MDTFGYYYLTLGPILSINNPSNIEIDTLPKFLMDSTTSPKVKITKGEGIGARSLARITSRVEGRVGAPK
jgi:hypothetical protein